MKTRLAIPTGKKRVHGGFAKCVIPFGKTWGTHYKEYDDSAYPNEEEAQVCDKCGELFMPSYYSVVYDTPSGELEPGCLYWNDSIPENYYWDNHKGPYLMAVCPGGHHWVIDGRASNCDMPNDRKHRCWVRHGEPGTPSFHVDKNGLSCNAGSGSIEVGKNLDGTKYNYYHGFLHNGQFT